MTIIGQRRLDLRKLNRLTVGSNANAKSAAIRIGVTNGKNISAKNRKITAVIKIRAHLCLTWLESVMVSRFGELYRQVKVRHRVLV